MKYFYEEKFKVLIGFFDTPICFADKQKDHTIVAHINTASYANLLRILDNFLENDKIEEAQLTVPFIWAYLQEVYKTTKEFAKECRFDVDKVFSHNIKKIEDAILYYANEDASIDDQEYYDRGLCFKFLYELLQNLPAMYTQYYINTSNQHAINVAKMKSKEVALKYYSKFEMVFNERLAKLNDIVVDGYSTGALEVMVTKSVFDFDFLQEMLYDNIALRAAISEMEELDQPFLPILCNTLNVNYDIKYYEAGIILTKDQKNVYMEYFRDTLLYQELPADIRDMYEDDFMLLGNIAGEFLPSFINTFDKYYATIATDLKMNYLEMLNCNINNLDIIEKQLILEDFTITKKVKDVKVTKLTTILHDLYIKTSKEISKDYFTNLLVNNLLFVPIHRADLEDTFNNEKSQDSATVVPVHINLGILN